MIALVVAPSDTAQPPGSEQGFRIVNLAVRQTSRDPEQPYATAKADSTPGTLCFAQTVPRQTHTLRAIDVAWRVHPDPGRTRNERPSQSSRSRSTSARTKGFNSDKWVVFPHKRYPCPLTVFTTLTDASQRYFAPGPDVPQSAIAGNVKVMSTAPGAAS
jgi:hypothetical protein